MLPPYLDDRDLQPDTRGSRSTLHHVASGTAFGAAGAGHAQHGALSAPVASACSPCRICLSVHPAASLVAPCGCRGTQLYVHKQCLATWQAVCASNFYGPIGLERAHRCGVCLEPYALPPPRPRVKPTLSAAACAALAVCIMCIMVRGVAGALVCPRITTFTLMDVDKQLRLHALRALVLLGTCVLAGAAFVRVCEPAHSTIKLSVAASC